MKKIFSISTTFLLFTFEFLLLVSCSLQKQIASSAKEDVLSNKALQTAHVGISIYEPATGKYWYNYQGDHYFVPASNTKLPTCYAAMKYLGDSLVGLRYNIQNDTTIEVSGTADPSFLQQDFKRQPVYEFLKRFKVIVIKNKIFDDYLGSGWSWNDYKESYMAERSSMPIYGNLVKFKWVNKILVEVTPGYFGTKTTTLPGGSLEDGFEISKSFDDNSFFLNHGKQKLTEIPFTPDIRTASKLLADTLKENVVFDSERLLLNTKIIHSQPTDSLLKITMHRSDNFFAEQTLLMVSNERLGIMSDEKIIDTLLKTDFKDLPQKPRWVDGSGLSRYNLFTPQDFVAILNKIKTEFGMERIKVILPTGNTGTLGNYYKAENNYIFAKTGTLSGVVSISGYLYTKKNKLLIFSVLVNNHQASATDVRRAVEKFIEEIRNKF